MFALVFFCPTNGEIQLISQIDNDREALESRLGQQDPGTFSAVVPLVEALIGHRLAITRHEAMQFMGWCGE